MAVGLGKSFAPDRPPGAEWKWKFKSRLRNSCEVMQDIFCLSHTDMTADTALSLDGTGRLDYTLKQGPKRDILLRRSLQGTTSDPMGPSNLEVKFRTRSKTGTLLHVQESSNYTSVKVRKVALCVSLMSWQCMKSKFRNKSFPNHVCEQ